MPDIARLAPGSVQGRLGRLSVRRPASPVAHIPSPHPHPPPSICHRSRGFSLQHPPTNTRFFGDHVRESQYPGLSSPLLPALSLVCLLAGVLSYHAGPPSPRSPVLLRVSADMKLGAGVPVDWSVFVRKARYHRLPRSVFSPIYSPLPYEYSLLLAISSRAA